MLTRQNTDTEGNTVVARGTVSALDPPRLLEFDTDIHGRLRWELEPGGDGTVLSFTAEVELPEEYEREVLDGGTIGWPNWHRDHKPDWDRILARYEAETGERASQPRSSS